jgi:hypothetical protein
VKIKFLSGPRAGEVSHAPKSQETQLLIDAGLIEIVPEKKPVAETRWGLGTGANSQQIFILGTCSLNCGTFRYTGPAAQAKGQKFFHQCGASGPVEIPDSVIEQYRVAKKEEKRIVGVDELNYYVEANRLRMPGERTLADLPQKKS